MASGFGSGVDDMGVGSNCAIDCLPKLSVSKDALTASLIPSTLTVLPVEARSVQSYLSQAPLQIQVCYTMWPHQMLTA